MAGLLASDKFIITLHESWTTYESTVNKDDGLIHVRILLPEEQRYEIVNNLIPNYMSISKFFNVILWDAFMVRDCTIAPELVDNLNRLVFNKEMEIVRIRIPFPLIKKVDNFRWNNTLSQSEQLAAMTYVALNSLFGFDF